jgi:taurine dioxygenase
VSPDAITARRLTPHFAAVVSGVDLSAPLTDAAFATIHGFLLEHAVLVFRGQTLENEALLDFSRRFGPLDIHHLQSHNLAEHPEIRIMTNKPTADGHPGAYNAGHVWHTDQSYKEDPMLGTVLLCDACPPEGGYTEFASLTAAYDALSGNLKRKLDTLFATHDRNFSYGERYPERPPLTPEQLAAVPPVRHPLVRIHRESKRKGLYISLSDIRDIDGMSRDDAQRLVAELCAHATKPDFVYRHHWSVGDLVIWDNRCILHRVTPFETDKYRRSMRRTQIKETGPFSLPA